MFMKSKANLADIKQERREGTREALRRWRDCFGDDVTTFSMHFRSTGVSRRARRVRPIGRARIMARGNAWAVGRA